MKQKKWEIHYREFSKYTNSMKTAPYIKDQKIFKNVYSSLEAKINQDWLYLVKHCTLPQQSKSVYYSKQYKQGHQLSV